MAEDDHPRDDGALVHRGEAVPSLRTPLTQSHIVEVAIEFIDDNGLSNLTMRRLGELLDVTAMSLYRHVPGKEAMLDLVTQALLAGLETDPEVKATPQDGWRDFVHRLAHGIRRVALKNPRAFPLVASRPPTAPWLIPPIKSLQWVERLLQGLMDEGFPPTVAVYGYQALSSLLLGHLLLEVSVHGGEQRPVASGGGVGGIEGERDLSWCPSLEAVRALLTQGPGVVEFDKSLEDLLDRMSRMLEGAELLRTDLG